MIVINLFSPPYIEISWQGPSQSPIQSFLVTVGLMIKTLKKLKTSNRDPSHHHNRSSKTSPPFATTHRPSLPLSLYPPESTHLESPPMAEIIPKETALQALNTIIQLHFEKTLEKKRAVDLQKKELWKLFQLFFIFLFLFFFFFSLKLSSH